MKPQMLPHNPLFRLWVAPLWKPQTLFCFASRARAVQRFLLQFSNFIAESFAQLRCRLQFMAATTGRRQSAQDQKLLLRLHV